MIIVVCFNLESLHVKQKLTRMNVLSIFIKEW